MYQYDATVIRVVDGDTVDLNVDLGFGVWREDRFRLYGPDPAGKMGLNAPEVSTQEGRDSRDWLKLVLKEGQGVRITTIKDRREKYGRYLVVIFLGEGNINQQLLDKGYAVLKEY